MSKKLQVFISSTYTDLLEERQAAVSAILKAGHLPAGMELFTAGDRTQWDTIKSWIEQSDVYMLILGGRYGSIDAESGLSYTEMEYDYAVSLGMPRFAVVISEEGLDQKVRNGGAAFMEKENGKLLTTFRKKVLSNISTFFSEPKEIRLAVFESLSDFSTNRDLIGWVRGNEVVDTQPIFDEVKRLSAENTSLRSQVTELQRNAQKVQRDEPDFKNIYRLMFAEQITVPKKYTVAKKSDEKIDLLNIFASCKDSFITGINNDMGMSDFHNFLFFTVAPKLATFEMVDYEKIAGAKYRRCIITTKGKKFLTQLALMGLDKSDSSEKKPAEQNAQGLAPSDASAERAATAPNLEQSEAATAPLAAPKKRATRKPKAS
jgi:hypothetical protein